MPEQTAERALKFWLSAGLIVVQQENSPPSPVSVKKVAAPKAPLTPARINELSLRDPGVAALMQETQAIVGRTLDSFESKLLLETYENSALPVDVLLTVVAYVAPRLRSKRSLMTAVSHTAEDWAEQGVTDGQAAGEYIKLLETREQREKQVALSLDTPDAVFTKPQKAHIARWFEEYGYNASFVREAYLRTGNSSVPYISSVLKSWHNKGYKRLRDIEQESCNAPAVSSRSNGAKSSGGSLLAAAIKKRGDGGDE